MMVMKFGGSSLAGRERIESAARIVVSRLPRRPIVVLSAIGRTTDALIAAGSSALAGKPVAAEIMRIKEAHYSVAAELGIKTGEIDGLFADLEKLLSSMRGAGQASMETTDSLVSFGEMLSVRIFSSYLEKIGVGATRHFDGWEAGIITDSEFGNAEFLPASMDKIRRNFSGLEEDYRYTPVVTGFIAKDASGRTTTMGRGGSDLTATIIGAALRAEEIEVWKDVDGLLTADPRVVKGAFPVAEISFQQASEMAYFGANIFHPRSIIPAMEANVPIRVKNSNDPERPGTLITAVPHDSSRLVKAMSFKRNVALVDIISTRMLGQYGFLASVFQAFADCRVCVDLVATSEVSVCATVNGAADLGALHEELGKIASVRILSGNAVMSIVCAQENSGKVMSQAFGSLARSGIEVQAVSYGASKGNICLVVNDSNLVEGANAVHRAFFGGGAG